MVGDSGRPGPTHSFLHSPSPPQVPLQLTPTFLWSGLLDKQIVKPFRLLLCPPSTHGQSVSFSVLTVVSRWKPWIVA